MIDPGGVLNCVVETWAPDGGCHTAASNHQPLLRLFTSTFFVSIDHTSACGQITRKNAFRHSFAEREKASGMLEHIESQQALQLLCRSRSSRP